MEAATSQLNLDYFLWNAIFTFRILWCPWLGTFAPNQDYGILQASKLPGQGRKSKSFLSKQKNATYVGVFVKPYKKVCTIRLKLLCSTGKSSGSGSFEPRHLSLPIVALHYGKSHDTQGKLLGAFTYAVYYFVTNLIFLLIKLALFIVITNYTF